MATAPRKKSGPKTVDEPAKPKVYRFSQFQAEADRSRAENPIDRPEVDPFVIEDVVPPIVITMPDSLDRILTIAELANVGEVNLGIMLPLLRAFCGDQFPRVWELVRRDKDDRVLTAITSAMLDHFMDAINSAIEAERDLPGGSEG